MTGVAPRAARVLEVCSAFLKLGLTSFGGPIAHLGYIRAECVEKRRWLDDDEYADVVALCQFLPGPSSSQVVFALGMLRAGLLGAIGASVCFLLPSAAAMIAFAYGVAAMGDLHDAGWLHGLKLAAVAVVAQAVWAMGVKLIGELKNSFGIGTVSTNAFDANEAAFLIKLLAHNLLRRWVAAKVSAAVKWQASWIRKTCICVPARLLRSGGRWELRLAPRPLLN